MITVLILAHARRLPLRRALRWTLILPIPIAISGTLSSLLFATALIAGNVAIACCLVHPEVALQWRMFLALATGSDRAVPMSLVTLEGRALFVRARGRPLTALAIGLWRSDPQFVSPRPFAASVSLVVPRSSHAAAHGRKLQACSARSLAAAVALYSNAIRTHAESSVIAIFFASVDPLRTLQAPLISPAPASASLVVIARYVLTHPLACRSLLPQLAAAPPRALPITADLIGNGSR